MYRYNVTKAKMALVVYNLIITAQNRKGSPK